MFSICLFCLTALLLLATGWTYFFDDLILLLPENDAITALVLLQLVLLCTGSLWVLTCCLAALAHRLVLRLRGI